MGGAEAFDLFGESLASGDFNNDGYDDLAVGIPFEDLRDSRNSAAGEIVNAGLITILNGSASSLSANDVQFITQDSIFNQGELPAGIGVYEVGEFFGTSMTVGDINGDRFVDLIIGTPNEGEDSVGGNAGSTMVVYGPSSRLTTNGAQYSSPVQSYAQNNNALADLIGEPGGDYQFGSAESVLDLNGDGYDELVIGTPRYEPVFSNDEIGSLHVLLGSRWGARYLAINFGHHSVVLLETQRHQRR